VSLETVLDAAIRVALMLGFVLTTVLILIWVERKVLGHIQQRLGPMRTGWHGWLQSPADAIKLLTKEDLMPATANGWAFRLAPFVVFTPILLIFVALPFTRELLIRNMDLGLFYILAVSAFSTVGFVMAGWGSDNKYALLGAVRAGAQLISYELPLVIAVLGVVMLARSLNLGAIVEQQSVVPYGLVQPLGLVLFLIATVAELNRQPFDIPIAESELVGGLFIEYSGIRWGIFFLSEFAAAFASAALCTLLFLGGWAWPWLPPAEVWGGWAERLVGLGWFLGKTYLVILIIIWLRGSLPRLRVDQLLSLAWKVLIPLAFLNLLLTGIYLLYGWLALVPSALAGLLLVYLVYIPPLTNLRRRTA